jgi:hypothetical protein
MILASHGLIASQITQFVGLLDLYPSAAAAYSLRKLRTAYTGSAIEVRRTNLDVADIGFTSTGELDTAALLAFTGTGALDNGFVTKWYDQSGNSFDCSQTTALNQPRIVSSGSVITINGIGGSKPSILFDGSNDFLTRTNFSFINYSMFSVQKSNGGVVWQNGNANGVGLNTSAGVSPNNQYSLYERAVSDHLFSTRTSDLRLISGIRNQSISKLNAYINSSLFSLTTSNANTPTTGFYIGVLDGNSIYFNGHQSELIFYTTDESSNLSGIQTNINDFYSIY